MISKLETILFRPMTLVALGALLIYAIVALGWAQRLWGRRERDLPRPIQWIGLILAVLAPALAIVCFGRVHFGGFDHSLLIDVAYRQLQGQAPYRDFINTTPAFFSLGAKWAMQLFGQRWTALVDFSACATLLANIWLAWLLVRITGRLLVGGLLAAVVTTMTMVVTSYWWYNQITALGGIIFLGSCWALLSARPTRSHFVSFTLALSLLAGMKPNVAGLLIAGASVILWVSLPSFRRAIVVSVGAAFLLFNVVLFLGLHTNLPELLKAYSNASERGLTQLSGFADYKWFDRGIYFTFFAIGVTPLIFLRRKISPELKRQYDLCLLGCLVGSYAMFANMESKMNDLVFVAFTVFLLAHALSRQNPDAARGCLRLATASLVAFVVYSGLGGWRRDRVEGIGYGAFYENGPTVSVQNGFFAGCSMSPRLVAVLAAAERSVAETPAKNYFFGPRMEFLYCALRLPSPPGLPLWWHPGSSYPRKKESELLLEWDRQKFQVAIFLKDDFTYFSPARMKLLTSGYVRDDSNPLLTIMRRRNAAELSR